MRIPGRRKLRQAGRWVQSRWRRGALILGYHRIADTAYDPYRICVSPENFAQQLAVIRETAAPLPMVDLLQGLARDQLPPGALALTFDDGYRDNLTHAAPLLQQYRVPATVFLVTGHPGGEFWWDELARMIDSPAGAQFHRELTGKDFPECPSARNAARSYLRRSLYEHLLPMSRRKREAALNPFREGMDKTAGTVVEIPRALTSAEIRELARRPGIGIGAHSVTHPQLTTLDPAGQRREISGSRQQLEALLGENIIGFSYPNGAFSPQTEQIVQEAGFAYACCSVENVCYPRRSRYALPRFWVPDIPGPAFARWLRRWLV